MNQFSTGLRNALNNNDGLAHQLTGVAAGASAGTGSGFLYLFAGAVPAGPDAALDMSSVHTLLGKVSSNAGGSTGVALAASASGVIQKNATETWSTGAMTFSGASSGSSTLTATFYRFCEGSDNGQGSSTTLPRMQGTIGTDLSYDMPLSNNILAAGANEVINTWQYQEGNF